MAPLSRYPSSHSTLRMRLATEEWWILSNSADLRREPVRQSASTASSSNLPAGVVLIEDTTSMFGRFAKSLDVNVPRMVSAPSSPNETALETAEL